jgi:hypothetical protein
MKMELGGVRLNEITSIFRRVVHLQKSCCKRDLYNYLDEDIKEVIITTHSPTKAVRTMLKKN